MERLVIEIPDNKSKLVKQVLKEFGVIFKNESLEIDNLSPLQNDLLKVSVWSEEDLKVFEESKKGFESFKPAEW